MARKRPRIGGITIAADLAAWLEQDDVNKSRAIENALRANVAEEFIVAAAKDDGMTEEEIMEARNS